MRISVKAKPNSKEEKIEQITEGQFIISVKELPLRGMANQAIIKLLAQYFSVSEFQVKIISGWTSRQKMIEINK